jgi:PadR family transcriptional regulator, regulatory protein PadR
MGRRTQLTIQTLRVLRPFLVDPRKKLSGAEIIRASGLASGTAYPIMLRLERSGMLTSEWEKGDPKKLGRPLRRYYKITAIAAAQAREAVREVAHLAAPALKPAEAR